MLSNAKIYDGISCPFNLIDKWIDIVNKELKRSDKDHASKQYFYSIKNSCYFMIADEGYAACQISFDMWGNLEIVVQSSYLLPAFRTLENLNDLQAKIEDVARIADAKSIVQGSHLGDRLYKYLARKGYKTCEMRKEIKWEKETL